VSASDWETEDYKYLAGIIVAFVPSPAPPGWLGIAAENRALDPAPRPSGSREAPTLFGVWSHEYSETAGTWDPTLAPVRSGELLYAQYSEPGAGRGHVLDLFRQFRAHIGAQGAGRLVLSPDLARVSRVGLQGEWYIEVLRTPFMGG
jgi:hypothetical protein